MKKKVGELYDKPIVVGNPNEFEKHEIPLSDLGGDSVDDGMEYFKLENPAIGGIDYLYCVSCIVENENGDRMLMYTPPGRERIAIQTSNKIIYNSDGSTMLERLISDANRNGLDFENEPTIKRITAKEYYSLLK
jgi:hypothetical protein